MSNTRGLPPRVWAVVEMIADKYSHQGTTADLILGRSRKMVLASWPRQEVFYYLYQIRRADGKHAFSMPMIGRMIGNRHHTSVLHGIRAFLKRIAKEKAQAIAA